MFQSILHRWDANSSMAISGDECDGTGFVQRFIKARRAADLRRRIASWPWVVIALASDLTARTAQAQAASCVSYPFLQVAPAGTGTADGTGWSQPTTLPSALVIANADAHLNHCYEIPLGIGIAPISKRTALLPSLKPTGVC